MKSSDMEALIYEIKDLRNKIKIHSDSNEYIYANIYKSWVTTYNHLLNKYNAGTNSSITPMSYNEYDLSTTQKTVKNATIKYFITLLDELIKKLKPILKPNVLKQ